MSEEEYIDDLDYIAGLEKHNLKLIKDNLQLQQENIQLKKIINKAKERSIYLQNTYGYILDDLTFLLMIGSDKE